MSEADRQWTFAFLDDWTRASRDYLDIPSEPVPKTVLFNTSCVWGLEDDRFKGRVHDGTVTLPNGARIPSDIIAVAMPGGEGQDPFLVLALLSVWHQHPQASKDPYLDTRIGSVALHEMIHVRQMPLLQRRIAGLGARYDLPSRLDDDVVESTYRDSTEFRSLFEAERDLLYRAVAESDPDRSRSLVRKAAAMAAHRHVRFFTGRNAVYAELEGIFLNMEGIGEWVRYRAHVSSEEWPHTAPDVIAFLRGTDNSWSQDEGLALVLLLDRFVPDWKARLMGPSMPSPWMLLHEGMR